MISLDDMAELARRLVDAEKSTERAEKNLKIAKERERLIREETLPCAMQELGLEKLKLSTGEEITVKQDVFASISAGNKEAAFAWLEGNGFGGLIKIELTIPYGKGDAEKATELYNELVERELPAELTQDVHAQTLKAFLREQVIAAKDVPMDLFGARPVWVAKVKPAKR